jgi:hypothetical protein
LERRDCLRGLTTGAGREAARKRAVVVVGDEVGAEAVDVDEDDNVSDRQCGNQYHSMNDD